MRRRGLVAAALTVAAAGAQPASAATVIGISDPGADTNDIFFCDGTSETCPNAFVQDEIDNIPVTAPSGVITSVDAQIFGTVAFVVYRPSVRDGSTLAGSYVGAVDMSTGSEMNLVETPARIPVADGDVVGVATADVDGGVAILSDASSRVFYTVFTDQINTTNLNPYALMLQATVEPDADGDEYGDETQDGCPTDPTTQGACPAGPGGPGGPGGPSGSSGPGGPTAAPTQKVALASKTAFAKKGKVSIPVSNPNAFAVSGKVTLKGDVTASKAVKVGSASYSLGAGASKTVKVKLSKKARTRLKKKGKLKLSFSTTTKDPAGKTLKAKGKLTVKPQPRKKNGGGGGNPLDGAYEAAPDSGPKIGFTVSEGGRRIVNLTGAMGGSCFTPGGFYLTTLFPAMTSLPVAADGSFSGQEELSGSTTTIENGKLANGVATGTISVSGAGCSTKGDFKSVRTGP